MVLVESVPASVGVSRVQLGGQVGDAAQVGRARRHHRVVVQVDIESER